MASTTAVALAEAPLLPLADDGCGVAFREEAATGAGDAADVTAENLLPYCEYVAPALTVEGARCLGETGLEGLLRGVMSSVVGTPLGMDTLATMPGYPARALRAACGGGNLGVKEPVTEELLNELLGELTFGVPTVTGGGAGPAYILRASAGKEDPRGGATGVNTPLERLLFEL